MHTTLPTPETAVLGLTDTGSLLDAVTQARADMELITSITSPETWSPMIVCQSKGAYILYDEATWAPRGSLPTVSYDGPPAGVVPVLRVTTSGDIEQYR